MHKFFFLYFSLTVQRVTKVLFSEVTTSRSRAVVGGFHNVAFGPVGKPISFSVFQ